MARRKTAFFCPRCHNMDLPRGKGAITSVIVRLCPRCTEDKYPGAVVIVKQYGIKDVEVIYG